MKKLIFSIYLFSFSVVAFSLPDTWYMYFVNQCEKVGVPVSLAGAILYKENPSLNSKTVSVNRNGSKDLGLWQLNSQYLYCDFIPRYWDRKDKFEWNNPYHSTYVAVRHIRWLYRKFAGDLVPQAKAFSTSLAYNAGYTAVITNHVPESSIEYAVSVVRLIWR